MKICRAADVISWQLFEGFGGAAALFYSKGFSSSSKRNHAPYFSQWFFTTSRVPTSQNSPQQKKNKDKTRRKQKWEGKAIIQRANSQYCSWFRNSANHRWDGVKTL